jgi:hypothetical protein
MSPLTLSGRRLGLPDLFSTSSIKVIVLLGFLLASSGVFASAGTFTAFGPQTYPRSTGTPVPFENSFAVLNPSAPYILQVQVAGVASATISVNGVAVVFTSDFDMNETYVERPVVLQASNVLTGEVRGKPDGVRGNGDGSHGDACVIKTLSQAIHLGIPCGTGPGC